MNVLSERVLDFGNKFHGRLDKLWLDVALDYVGHGEWGLAFETLCDYLSEYDVSISMKEYDEMMGLAADMELDLNAGYLKYLKALILHEDENGSRYFISSKLGKIFLPKDWSGEKIFHEVFDILTAPDTHWYAQTGHGEMYAKNGAPVRWVAYEVRDGERIKVVYEPATGRLVTAHPYDRPVPQYEPVS